MVFLSLIQRLEGSLLYLAAMEGSGINAGVTLVELSSAPDDPLPSSPEYQRELGNLLHSLRSKGIGVSGNYQSGGGGLPVTFVTTTASIGPAFGTVIGEWLNARYGRKAKLRVGDTEAEAQTGNEMAGL